MRHVAVATLHLFAAWDLVYKRRARHSVLHGPRRPEQDVAHWRRQVPGNIATNANAYPSPNPDADANTDHGTNTNANDGADVGTDRGTNTRANATPHESANTSMGTMAVQCRRCGARSLWQQTPDCTPALLKDTKRRQTMR